MGHTVWRQAPEIRYRPGNRGIAAVDPQLTVVILEQKVHRARISCEVLRNFGAPATSARPYLVVGRTNLASVPRRKSSPGRRQPQLPAGEVRVQGRLIPSEDGD